MLLKCWSRTPKKRAFLGYVDQELVNDAVGQVLLAK